jgi:hypothetical protein
MLGNMRPTRPLGYSGRPEPAASAKRIVRLPGAAGKRPRQAAGKGTTRETFLGNIPLRCQRCGNATPTIGVRQLSTA